MEEQPKDDHSMETEIQLKIIKQESTDQHQETLSDWDTLLEVSGYNIRMQYILYNMM